MTIEDLKNAVIELGYENMAKLSKDFDYIMQTPNGAVRFSDYHYHRGVFMMVQWEYNLDDYDSYWTFEKPEEMSIGEWLIDTLCKFHSYVKCNEILDDVGVARDVEKQLKKLIAKIMEK